MPKVISSQQIPLILDAITRYPKGVGIEELTRVMNATGISRRTLQRRLATLLEQQQITTAGIGRGLRYCLPNIDRAANQLNQSANKIADEIYVPLSAQAEEVKAYVIQPRQQRKPVSYQNQFLEQYQPNQTGYLNELELIYLHGLGRSPTEQAPAGTFARDILHRLLIDLSWASSKLEGNTYSHLDTERLIEFGQAAEGKNALETQMILNHKAAIEYLVHHTAQSGITTETIIALHAFLSDGLMPDPLFCGQIRRRLVEISGSVYQPIAMPQRLEELFNIVVSIAREIKDPFEQSFFMMVHLPYLQPFEDVNKRVSRLAANIPLIQHNLCPLSFIDVPQQAYIHAMLGIYELNRVELLRDVFIWAYKRSCQQYIAVHQQLVPPDTFRLRYRNELTEVIRAIIRSAQPASELVIYSMMPVTIPKEEQPRFITLVLEEFKTLHAGNVIRFGLRPLEFSAWQKK